MLTFAAQMPIAPLERMARVHDTWIWRVLEHHVGAAREKLDSSSVSEAGCDETSACRGQDYVSIFMDLGQRRTDFATEGADADTVKAFADDLAAHDGSPKTQGEAVCCDMIPAFIAGINEHLAEHPEDAEAEPAAGVEGAELVCEASRSTATLADAEDAGPHHPHIVFGGTAQPRKGLAVAGGEVRLVLEPDVARALQLGPGLGLWAADFVGCLVGLGDHVIPMERCRPTSLKR